MDIKYSFNDLFVEVYSLVNLKAKYNKADIDMAIKIAIVKHLRPEELRR